jgi:hypothetical protein
MTDKNQEQMGFRGSEDLRSSENDLDRALDAALAKYAAIEPRAGLEERVLANLRAERTRAADHSWWRWGVVAALAAAIVVAVAIASRPGKPAREVVRHHPVAPIAPTQNEPQRKFASNGTVHVQVPTQRAVRHSPVVTAVVKTGQPKLDQFPSPQPLSEQEKILANYVAKYPEHAALIAEARMEQLRHDEEERAADAGNDSALTPNK